MTKFAKQLKCFSKPVKFVSKIYVKSDQEMDVPKKEENKKLHLDYIQPVKLRTNSFSTEENFEEEAL